MKFLSNIGWMSKNSQLYNFEILNHEYLFNIPITEISNLLHRKKPQITFYVPLKKIYGCCTLSASGNMINFEIEGKKFGTPVSLLNNVSLTGIKKPLSEIDDRPELQIARYSIYTSILSCLIQSPPEDTAKELEKYEISTINLIKKFHGENPNQLDYNDPNIQAAYMLCYFPSYIENIFHLLSHETCYEVQSIFQNHMKTSFYGCGPSPDFLGYLAFLNKNYRSIVTDANVNFFDMHDWGYWRENCVNNFSKIFADGINITANTNEINLLECDDSTYLSERLVDGTNLHIFQNCTTDIYTQCKSYRKICSIFNNFFNHIDPGSIVILNDFLGKGDSMNILNAIKKKIEDNHEIVLLNNRYNVNEYTPNFEPNPDIQLFLNRCYRQVGKKPRNNTGYSYLIVQRRE